MTSREHVVAVVQARMGSSRLPGKVLREASGRTLLAHLVQRLRRARTIDRIVIATTTSPADDELERAAEALGVGISRGSESDVLSRYAAAIAPLAIDTVVRVTADCPLLDEAEVDRVVGEYLIRKNSAEPADYVTNQAGNVRHIPRGLDVEVMSRSALERAQREATRPGDREHVTPYLYREPGRFRCVVTHYPYGDFSDLRLTVDTPEDLALVRALFEALGPDARFLEVAAYLRERPELKALNSHIEQKTVLGEDELRRKRIGGRLLLARADAGASIGFGHVARTSALLEAWVELGGLAELVGAGISGKARKRLEPVARVMEEALTPDALVDRARAVSAAAVVLDGYRFDAEEAALARARLPLLVWDDLAERVPNADVILNQNLGARPEAYAGARGRVLAGAAYLCLRSEFRASLEPSRAARRTETPVNRVLLGFGASDPAALGPRVAAALCRSLPVEVTVTVVVGPGVAASTREALADLGSQSANLEILEDPAKLTDVLSSATVAVLAAGSMAWEALTLGVPSLLVAVAENQRVVVAGAVAAEAAEDAGGPDPELEARVSKGVLTLLSRPDRRRELSERAARLFDGRGCYRVIDALLDAMERRRS
jgi:spore coat polysaccharide biosynthesis protein SpsF